MTSALGKAIRVARHRQGLTQAAVAEALGVTRAAVGQWEAGTTQPSAHRLLQLNVLLRINFNSIPALNALASLEDEIPEEPRPDARILETFTVPVFQLVQGPLGIVRSKGFDGGLFHVRRFSFFDYVPNVYAISFSSSLLSPKYEPGNIAYVDPDNIPRVGDYGIFSFVGTGMLDDEHPGFVRKLVFLDPERIIVAQHNPERTDEYAISSVYRMQRLISETELVTRRGK